MSTLAKIFVVFNLVMTLVFFGSAATLYLNRENWRQKYNEYKLSAETRLKEMQDRFEKQKGQLNLIAQDNSSLKAKEANLMLANQQAQTTIGGLKKDLGDRELTVQKHLNALTESQKTIQEKERAISEKDTLIAKLRDDEQAARAAQEKAVHDATRLTLDLNSTNQELSETLIAHKETQDKLESHEIVLKNLAAKGYPVDDALVPPIEGIVEAVNEKDNLVVLSVGKDQNALEGYKFTVRRGGEYIGKVEVIKVYEDLSGARVSFLVPGQQVKVGDVVKTTN
jgi:predicted transcriptional regulator